MILTPEFSQDQRAAVIAKATLWRIFIAKQQTFIDFASTVLAYVLHKSSLLAEWRLQEASFCCLMKGCKR
jgi:hypothetical protein